MNRDTYIGHALFCGNPEKHLPHIMGEYTGGGGEDFYTFCTGKGDGFRVVEAVGGCPRDPAVLVWEELGG